MCGWDPDDFFGGPFYHWVLNKAHGKGTSQDTIKYYSKERKNLNYLAIIFHKVCDIFT